MRYSISFFRLLPQFEILQHAKESEILEDVNSPISIALVFSNLSEVLHKKPALNQTNKEIKHFYRSSMQP